MLVVVHLSDGTLDVLPAAFVYRNGVACLRFTASRFSPYAFVVDQYGLLGGAYTGYDPLIGLPKTGDGGAGLPLLLPVLAGALLAGVRKARG
jgi:hypothetical protein